MSRNLKPKKETIQKLEELRKDDPIALKEFFKKQPDIKLIGQGSHTKVSIDMDEYTFDDTAQNEIRKILSTNIVFSYDSYLKTTICQKIVSAIIKLLRSGNIILKKR